MIVMLFWFIRAGMGMVANLQGNESKGDTLQAPGAKPRNVSAQGGVKRNPVYLSDGVFKR
jgi:hypothetical protein